MGLARGDDNHAGFSPTFPHAGHLPPPCTAFEVQAAQMTTPQWEHFLT